MQIADLNALNARLAVIRFKQLRGFYATDESVYQLLFDITDLRTVSLVDHPKFGERDACPTQWAAVRSIAEKIGFTGESLRLSAWWS